MNSQTKTTQQHIAALDVEIGVLLAKKRDLIQSQQNDLPNAFDKLKNVQSKRKKDIFENDDFQTLQNTLKEHNIISENSPTKNIFKGLSEEEIKLIDPTAKKQKRTAYPLIIKELAVKFCLSDTALTISKAANIPLGTIKQ